MSTKVLVLVPGIYLEMHQKRRWILGHFYMPNYILYPMLTQLQVHPSTGQTLEMG